jgi:hypothetical protein
MPRLWQCSVLLLGLAVSLFPVASAAAQQPGGIPGQGGARQPAPPPDVRAGDALHRAYDALTLLSVWTSANKVKLPDDLAPLVDPAKDFYRQAHQAYQQRNYTKSEGLAYASFAAAQGMINIMHALTPPAAGLPAPPEPPDTEATEPASPNGPPRTAAEAARQAFSEARQHIVEARQNTPVQGPARTFLNAAGKFYEQGRQAYQSKDYTKALDLASAADVWTTIGQHLRRAEGGPAPAQAGQPSPVPPAGQQRR